MNRATDRGLNTWKKIPSLLLPGLLRVVRRVRVKVFHSTTTTIHNTITSLHSLRPFSQ